MISYRGRARAQARRTAGSAAAPGSSGEPAGDIAVAGRRMVSILASILVLSAVQSSLRIARNHSPATKPPQHGRSAGQIWFDMLSACFADHRSAGPGIEIAWDGGIEFLAISLGKLWQLRNRQRNLS